MNIKELRKEVEEIKRIFLSAKYYELDFKYVHSIRLKFPVVYKTFYFFIERVYHSISVALILDLCKLFDKREKYSFIRLKNKMNENYEKSELNCFLSKSEFGVLFKPINSETIVPLLKKLKDTRDKYYAHFDRTKPDFIKIQINSSETNELISIGENLLKTIELKYFGAVVNFDMTSGELGHKIFERLNEWEKYRKKYGLLNINNNFEFFLKNHKHINTMNLIEKIITNHSKYESVKPGDIVDIEIDARVARDFGGANVVKNIINNGLKIDDPAKTFFTFDCNPGGSDQKYAANQQYCRLYARENDIKIYDIDSGIGTHLAIDKGLILPGGTFVSTDSHANIMGAIGAFGQGMGDQDIAAAWAKGASWFKVPKSVKIIIEGKRPENISAKDIVLNLLSIFGANKLLGCSVEFYGEEVDKLTLDERITISSMATEMGAIIILFTPTDEIVNLLEEKTGKKITLITADDDAVYEKEFNIDISKFVPMVARPGHPHDDTALKNVKKTKIDSAFIGSCTNGRMEDLRIAAEILKNKKVAPGVVLKIVPSTDVIWQQALEEGLIKIFKDAGALVSNAGCAGCAAGQVGQNGPDEITVSTGNRNFPGKQGKGEVYLASPATVAASAVAGYLTNENDMPDNPAVFVKKGLKTESEKTEKQVIEKKTVVEGKVWLIQKDDIDTDMIFHNRYLTITDINEMGQYAFDNLEGYEDFAKQAKPGDIVMTTKNFGAGSSRQQAVDCFKALGIQCILAESYGAIYERNAINAAFPILTYQPEIIEEIDLIDGDKIRIDFVNGDITNLKNNKSSRINKFYDVQLSIYQNDGLLG